MSLLVEPAFGPPVDNSTRLIQGGVGDSKSRIYEFHNAYPVVVHNAEAVYDLLLWCRRAGDADSDEYSSLSPPRNVIALLEPFESFDLSFGGLLRCGTVRFWKPTFGSMDAIKVFAWEHGGGHRFQRVGAVGNHYGDSETDLTSPVAPVLTTVGTPGSSGQLYTFEKPVRPCTFFNRASEVAYVSINRADLTSLYTVSPLQTLECSFGGSILVKQIMVYRASFQYFYDHIVGWAG